MQTHSENITHTTPDTTLSSTSSNTQDNIQTHTGNTPPNTPDTTLPLTSSNTQKNIPTPFKKALFWPAAPTDTKRRRAREKLPAVVTPPQMIQYLKQKEEIKNKRKKTKRRENNCVKLKS